MSDDTVDAGLYRDKVARLTAKLDQARADLREAQHASRVRGEIIEDILVRFSPSGSGHTARVGQVQIRKWYEQAGLSS